MAKAIKAGALYTGRPEPPLQNMYVSWDEGRITSVTRRKPRGAEVMGEYPVVTPAFIDAHSHIGMRRAGDPPDEGEANERLDSVLPYLDAIHSVYMDDPAFKDSVEHGVLYSCVLPGSGNIIGGRSALIRNYADDVEEAFMKHTGMKAAFGYNPRSTHEWKGTRPYTRMGAAGILRRWLIKASDTLKLVEKGKKSLEEVEPEVKAIFPVIKGEEPLRVHVHRADDVMALLMLKREFGFKATIEHAGDIYREKTFSKIREAGIPVVYGPLDAFPYKTELRHYSWRNIAALIKASPLYGLMSDHPVTLQRNLYLQLRFFLRQGMSRGEALSLITLRNAEILGVADKLGTIEKGKWASLIAWSGDPFSLDSYPTLVVAEGRILVEE